MFLNWKGTLGLFRVVNWSSSSILSWSSSNSKVFSLMFLMDFETNWTGFASESRPRIATSFLVGESPKIHPKRVHDVVAESRAHSDP